MRFSTLPTPIKMKKRLTYATAAALASIIAGTGIADSRYRYENKPPVINGFINPDTREALSEIEAFPCQRIELSWIDVEDPENQQTDTTLEKIVDAEGNQVDTGSSSSESSFAIRMPGTYYAVFKADDGQDSTRKVLTINITRPEDVLDKDLLKIYRKVEANKGNLQELGEETLLGYFTLLSLAGAESDLEHTDVKKVNGKRVRTIKRSGAGAVGWLQVTAQGIKGIERKMKETRRILSTVFDDLDSLERITLHNYTTDLEDLDLKRYGWNEAKYNRLISAEKTPINTRNRIRYVLLPTYLAFRKIFPEMKVDQSRLSEKGYNAKVGAANLLMSYLELSSLQAIRSKGRYRWVYRPRTYFKKRPNLQAFDLLDAVAAYNAGVGAVKRAYIQAARKGRYEPMRNLVKETNGHRKRFIRYHNKLKALDQTLKRKNYPSRFYARGF